MQKNEFRHDLLTFTKINSKIHLRAKYKVQTMKLLKQNIKKLGDLSLLMT
jgi:hypothetical protein